MLLFSSFEKNPNSKRYLDLFLITFSTFFLQSVCRDRGREREMRRSIGSTIFHEKSCQERWRLSPRGMQPASHAANCSSALDASIKKRRVRSCNFERGREKGREGERGEVEKRRNAVEPLLSILNSTENCSGGNSAFEKRAAQGKEGRYSSRNRFSIFRNFVREKTFRVGVGNEIRFMYSPSS